MLSFSVVDAGFGDSGKGTAVDYLCYKYPIDLVIKSNGGAQCGHNVVTPDGKHYEFSQMGSGSFQNIPTYLSDYFIVNPINLFNEYLQFSESFKIEPDLYIDENCLVTTPFHVKANQMNSEIFAHGTCGKGVGETVRDNIEHGDQVLFVRDLFDNKILKEKFEFLRELYRKKCYDLGLESEEISYDTFKIYCDAFKSFTIVTTVDRIRRKKPKGVIYESGQGVLLDQYFGFHPHTTWSNTTFENSDLLHYELFNVLPTHRVLVTRPYLTRHGNGPFPTYDKKLTENFPDKHNKTNKWQLDFKVGYPDEVLMRYVKKCIGGADFLFVTHYDTFEKFPAKLSICDSYSGLKNLSVPLNREEQEWNTKILKNHKPSYEMIDKWQLDNIMELIYDARIEIKSYGPTYKDKVTRPLF